MLNNKYKNIAKVKAVERKNEQKLLVVNPKLDNGSGIYILWRTEVHAYVGQSVGLLTRLAQHLAGYSQHIDLSLKKHKLYSSDNPYGYRVDFIHCDKSELDDKEREYIQKCIDKGWILKNKTSGGQDDGKEKIADYKPPKTYRQGIQAGKKTLAKELKSIISKHLTVRLKEEKKGNKVSEKQLEKFNRLLDEKNYGGNKDVD